MHVQLLANTVVQHILALLFHNDFLVQRLQLVPRKYKNDVRSYTTFLYLFLYLGECACSYKLHEVIDKWHISHPLP